VFNENRHDIVIKSDPASVRYEILWWGEAVWWPQNSLMRFVRLTERPLCKGTRYRQEVTIPFAPSWEVEIDNLTETSITRRFLNGMFAGFETVSFIDRAGNVEVSYRMHYEVRGLLNRLLWLFIFQALHDKNIELILASLKTFLEKGKKKE
jgi:hypothetical protein